MTEIAVSSIVSQLHEYPPAVMIIVNWNGLEDTKTCVNSALNLSYPNRQIIVVDNGSTIDETKTLKELYKDRIHALRTEENNGYSAGINLGIRYVLNNIPDTKYFLIANNDVVFEQESLKKIIAFMETHPSIGIAASKILLMKGDVVFSVGQKWDLRTGFVRNVGYGERNKSESTEPFEIDCVPGAAFIVKRKVIEKIGLFDEKYFLYFEEPDYCLRARRKGYKTYLVPESIVYHKPATSIRKVGTFAFYCFKKSKLRFIIKNLESLYFPLAMAVNMMHFLLSSCAASVRRRNSLLFFYTSKAAYEALMEAKEIRSSKVY
ncbi:MAG: glycosyltransferase family 2 protein [Candidatus Hodarchaeota archaeon]